MAGGVRALGGEEVPEPAKVHLGKAYQHFQSGAYENAEAELKRAAFFAPEWQPLTYDLAVVAEAQGHIDDAIERYEAFRPNAQGDTGVVVDQRIAELRERKVEIKKEYRRQLALAGTFLAISVGAAAGGGGYLIWKGVDEKNGIEENDARIDVLDKMLESSPNDPMAMAWTDEKSALESQNSKLSEDSKKHIGYGAALGIYGLLAVAYAGLYMAKVVKSKERRALALTPTARGVAVSF